ncbi:MAG: UDP-N-acetylglucosamine 2-epimerase [Infirmifilum sp.]
MIRNMRNDIVAVYALGDTASTLATSIASAYEGVPFIHDEAGMRSFDLSMPEEINRRIADAVASMHFAPTKLAYYNLLMEGVNKTNLYLVGSTAVDALKIAEPLVYQKEPVAKDSIVLTLHRRENITDIEKLRKIIEFVNKVSTSYTVVFPVHPHTRRMLEESRLIRSLSRGILY